RRQRVRAKRGPMTGSAPKQSRTSTLDCFASLAMTAPENGAAAIRRRPLLELLLRWPSLCGKSLIQPGILGNWTGRNELPLGLFRRRAWRFAAPRREHGGCESVRHGLSVRHLHHQHHGLDRDGPDRRLSRVSRRGDPALAAVSDDRYFGR